MASIDFDYSESATDIKTLIIRIECLNFRTLPKMPGTWKDRIDDLVWEEFISCLENAVPIDTTEREMEYKACKKIGMTSICFLCIGGLLAAFLGCLGAIITSKTLWIDGMILGIIVFITSFALIPFSARKCGEIDQKWKLEFKYNLRGQLSNFNDKYQEFIICDVIGCNDNDNNDDEQNKIELNENEKQPGIIRMYVMMELLAEKVDHIPDQHTTYDDEGDGDASSDENEGATGHGIIRLKFKYNYYNDEDEMSASNSTIQIVTAEHQHTKNGDTVPFE